jgi:predicted nucleic acid-binding protein
MLAADVIHFDTNFLVESTLANSVAHGRVRVWSANGEVFGMNTVAWAEYLSGPLDAQGEALARQIVSLPEPLLASDAELASRLFNLTGRRSRSLADCMIAATAIRCGARMATNNTGDFQPFVPHGLMLA